MFSRHQWDVRDAQDVLGKQQLKDVVRECTDEDGHGICYRAKKRSKDSKPALSKRKKSTAKDRGKKKSHKREIEITEKGKKKDKGKDERKSRKWFHGFCRETGWEAPYKF